MKVIIRPYFAKSGNAIKTKYYCVEPCTAVISIREIWEHIDDGFELEMLPPQKGKNYHKVSDDRKTINYHLLSIIEQREKTNGKSDLETLTKIIRKGGFTEYIKELES